MLHKSRLTYNDFIKYFRDKFSNRERHDFEKDVMTDLFESDALDGLSSISADEFEQDIMQLRKKTKQTETYVVPFWRKPSVKVAASVVILVGLFSIFYIIKKNIAGNFEAEEVAESYDEAILLADTVTAEPVMQEDLSEAAKPVNKPQKTEKKQPAIVPAKSKGGSYKEDISDINEKIVEDDIAVVREELEKRMAEKYQARESAKVKTDDLSKKAENIPEPATPRFAAAEEVSMQMEMEDVSGNTTISGIVTNQDGNPLPGACVVVEGTANGAVSDENGRFEIAGVANKAKLVFSYVGYLTEEMEATPGEELTVNMIDDVTTLEEILVSGYGSTAESDISYQGSTMQAEDKKVKSSSTGNVPYLEYAKPKITYMADYKKWLKAQLDYSKFSNLHGNFEFDITLTVNTDSTLSDVHLSGSMATAVTDELLRVLSEDKWIPANTNGIPRESEANFTIQIELE